MSHFVNVKWLLKRVIWLIIHFIKLLNLFIYLWNDKTHLHVFFVFCNIFLRMFYLRCDEMQIVENILSCLIGNVFCLSNSVLMQVKTCKRWFSYYHYSRWFSFSFTHDSCKKFSWINFRLNKNTKPTLQNEQCSQLLHFASFSFTTTLKLYESFN